MSPFVLDEKYSFYSIENEHMLPSPKSTKTIVFTTYNAGCGKKLEQIARDINSNSLLKESELLFLQEIEAYPNEEQAQAEKLAKLCGFIGVYAPVREEKKRGTQGTHGLAILSKYPIAETAVFELPRYNLGERTRRRVCITAKIMLPNGDFIRVYNIHLDTRINAVDRIEQLKAAVNDALRYPDDKIIIAGDVNTINFDEWDAKKFIRKWIPQKLWVESQRIKVDAYMKESGFSYPLFKKGDHTMNEWLQKMLLDAIYVRNLSIENSSIEYSLKGSDHFPMTAFLAWK